MSSRIPVGLGGDGPESLFRIIHPAELQVRHAEVSQVPEVRRVDSTSLRHRVDSFVETMEVQVINAEARVDLIGLQLNFEGVIEHMDGALILTRLLVCRGKVQVVPRIGEIEAPSVLQN